MSQRDSGYARQERDLYETPEWVTVALRPHIPARVRNVWEPACGSGKMVRALEAMGYHVVANDIETGLDYLDYDILPPVVDAVITNPPYKYAADFISRSMERMDAVAGVVAMLLRTDYDHAASRTDMFSGPGSKFAKKLVLTRRIKWFEDSKGQPSFNHAWFIWDWQHQGAPTLAYGP